MKMKGWKKDKFDEKQTPFQFWITKSGEKICHYESNVKNSSIAKCLAQNELFRELGEREDISQDAFTVEDQKDVYNFVSRSTWNAIDITTYKGDPDFMGRVPGIELPYGHWNMLGDWL